MNKIIYRIYYIYITLWLLIPCLTNPMDAGISIVHKGTLRKNNEIAFKLNKRKKNNKGKHDNRRVRE